MAAAFNFDKQFDRRNTDSLKWGKCGDEDVIPMWVADMDFQSPPAILAALHERVEHGIFGYATPTDELLDTVVARLEARYQWRVQHSWIVWLPGLVPALNVACRAFVDDSDEVLTFTPIYPPFLTAPRMGEKRLKTIPLCRTEGVLTFDIERFESEITSRSRLLLLCNPHNPVGRRYSREEIRTVAGICLEHNIILCSDEVHCDLILDGGQHVPAATLSDEISANTITLMSPSKTFNIAGLNCAFAIIANEGLRKRFVKSCKGIVPGPNALGYAACLAAYRDCEEWRISLIDYLRGNRDIVYRSVNEDMPGLSMGNVEATYLAWIDARGIGVADPAAFFRRAGVMLSDGRDFGGAGHVRLNFGCPRVTLLEAIDRIKRALANL